MADRFNLRVYGILYDSKGKVLVCDEIIKGNKYTKFPGGGLELGEGLEDGLKREFSEECNVRVSVGRLVFTNTQFVPSKFDNSQLHAFYFEVSSREIKEINTSNTPFDFSNGNNECFRWIERSELLNQECLTLPLDRKVAELLSTK